MRKQRKFIPESCPRCYAEMVAQFARRGYYLRCVKCGHTQNQKPVRKKQVAAA